MMILTNTIEFTEIQSENLHSFLRTKFEKQFTDDFSHFSLNGTRLNFKTRNQEVIFEIHSEAGSFWGLIDVNEKKQALKKSLKFIKH